MRVGGCDVGSLGEYTENADVTEVDTQEVMTCRKYSWTGADSTQLCYGDKQTIDDDDDDDRQQQQQQERVDEDETGVDDATSEDEEQRRQNR